ncbi:MAG: class I SAM-dependent methyltransferase, partial [Candidatus Omnitrophica bacterium]|nr:class I SAM-dependent methyltransferase [Candidatus Omnitrophota bacterium]
MNVTRCILCGSHLYEVVYNFAKENKTAECVYKITQSSIDNPPLGIARCRNCGFVFANPQDEVEKIISAYQYMQDELYLQEEAGRRKSARIVLKRIAKFRRSGRLLEIGCSAGFLLDEARKLGWQVYGVEVSKWAVKYCKEKLGLENIFEGSLEEARFPYNYFDAIVMLDVIEHLHNPHSVLEESRRILKPAGILCVSTPDISSLLSRFLKARWWGIQRAHLFYFNKKTLREMLFACGFKVVKFKSHVRIFSAGYWQQRLRAYNNIFCKLAARCLNIFSKKHLIKLNLYDQIEVYAVKQRSLRYISDDEHKEFGLGKKMKTIVVLPAYNAAKTLELTLKDIPKDIVDDII